jgi:epoxyqueuosine reductase QueG
METYIRDLINRFIEAYPAATGADPIWGKPLIAVAAAADPIFLTLKDRISPTHALPGDLLAGARSVVVYFIPFIREVPISNIGGRETSLTWATAYIATNKLILDTNTHVHDELAKRGYTSAILPATHNFDPQKLISDWSHRHIAYIAGLGTFGLNNMLITSRGCCGRLGSIVTDLELTPTPRPAGENCLHKAGGGCKKCVDHCVNAALTLDTFDRFRCEAMCRENADRLSHLGLADVCGKCLVGLPCSFTSPARNT